MLFRSRLGGLGLNAPVSRLLFFGNCPSERSLFDQRCGRALRRTKGVEKTAYIIGHEQSFPDDFESYKKDEISDFEIGIEETKGEIAEESPVSGKAQLSAADRDALKSIIEDRKNGKIIDLVWIASLSYHVQEILGNFPLLLDSSGAADEEIAKLELLLEDDVNTESIVPEKILDDRDQIKDIEEIGRAHV